MSTSGEHDLYALIDRELQMVLAPLPATQQAAVLERVLRLVQRVTSEQRRRCADVCRERAALWRATGMGKSALASAREEARARANEAQYLADAFDAPPMASTEAD